MDNTQGTQCMVWGRGEDGVVPFQLVSTGADHSSAPKLLSSLKSVSQVACGGKHSIAVTGNGEVYTWGWNWYGQLGNGGMRDQLNAQPVRSLALARALTQASIVAIAAGKEHSVALTNGGAVYSWGGGKEGQLGNGEEDSCQPIPRLITKLHSVRVTMLCAGGDHTLSISDGGTVYSWGRGANGRLGHGDCSNRPSPTLIKALVGLNVTMIACGWSHSLAVCSKGKDLDSLYSWGKGDSGQLGLGDRMDVSVPTEICLEADLRTSSDDAASRSILPFSATKISSIAAGYFHTGLIVRAPGNSTVPSRVYTWGWGEHGQLGHATVEDEVVPRIVAALKGTHVVQMACGGAHTMVITDTTECYGFGNSEFSQLGVKEEPNPLPEGSSSRKSLTSTHDELVTISGSKKIYTLPTAVHIEGYTIVRVACGWWHTVAIVQNCTNSIQLFTPAKTNLLRHSVSLSPPPPPLINGVVVGPVPLLDGESEKDNDVNEDDDWYEVASSPSPTSNVGLLSKIRGAFGRNPQSDKERALDEDAATVEWKLILSHWPSNKSSKRTRVMWRSGIPPNMRKEVWVKALQVIPSERYEETMLSVINNRSIRLISRETSEAARLISLDVPRTYPTLGMFQKDCSLNQPLQDVLEAAALSSPILGYCQGMSYLASTLLMYMEASLSFDVLAILTEHPLLRALFAMNVPIVVQHLRIFEFLFAKRLPRVYENFRQLGITSDQYAMEWMMTLFSRALPLEISHRIWDCFVMEGEIFLYRAAIGILKMDRRALEEGTFEQCFAILKKNFKDVDETVFFRKIFSVRVPKYLLAMVDRLRNNQL